MGAEDKSPCIRTLGRREVFACFLYMAVGDLSLLPSRDVADGELARITPPGIVVANDRATDDVPTDLCLDS
ncbi:hypothetical protein D9M68_964630 [compost metagenome]